MNAISGRDTQLLRTGSVTYHSDSNHAGNGKDSVGYVRQDDFLLPYLTVLETITFAAELRLPKSVSAEVREQIVKETIFELGLEDCQNTLIGGGRRKGISGGEKRRVSIGCALVTLPSILVLDEPTTGLDSFSSAILLSLLSLLAKRGRSIIISIHQPRSESFEIVRFSLKQASSEANDVVV